MYLYVMWFSITEILFLFNQSPARQLINDFKGQIVKNLENHDDFNDNCNIIIISLDTIDLSTQICSIKNNQAKSAGNDYSEDEKIFKNRGMQYSIHIQHNGRQAKKEHISQFQLFSQSCLDWLAAYQLAEAALSE